MSAGSFYSVSPSDSSRNSASLSICACRSREILVERKGKV